MKNKKPSQLFLRTLTLQPENQEAPISHIENHITPEQYMYRRNHLHYPDITRESFELWIGGLVQKPARFPLTELFKMPAKTITSVLECSGNRRSEFRPRVFGEQWDYGAVSQAQWTGISLRYLLSLVGVRENAVEAVFTGADAGTRTDMDGVVHFQRSMPVSDILASDDILVAYAYNNAEIPYRHGYPLRLIVPSWYAMASVKWLQGIELIDTSFTGPFQAVDYNYYPYADADAGKIPVTFIQTNSIIQQPQDLEQLSEGVHSLYGLAWSGLGEITAVEVSFDNGDTWHAADWERHAEQSCQWSHWHFEWRARKGFYTIRVRARDSSGYQQPQTAYWNRKGYGYNAWFRVRVQVE